MPSSPKRPLNIAQIARLAGVSKATISRFVNGKTIRAPARARVESVIRQFDYSPNRLAQGLKSRRSTSIGLVLPDISNPFFPEVVKGAETAARSAGYHLIVTNSSDDPAEERQRLQVLKGLRVDGILLVPAPDPGGPGPIRDRIADLGVPVVFVDRDPGFPVDLVSIDNVRAAEDAVSHLCRLGHRRVALLTVGRPISVHVDRAQGYRRALKAAGLKVEPRLVVKTASTVIDGIAAASRLLEREPRLTAIFTTSNRLAMAAISAVQIRGLRCPEDVSVVGFDDFEWEAIFKPRLTTIAQPAAEIGQRAARLLLERITGTRKGSPERILLESKLVVRESCGLYCV